MPPESQVTDMSGFMDATGATALPAEGAIRIAMVKLKDASGEPFPVDNRQINLVSEIGRHQFETVLLDADAPSHAVEAQAPAKQCDSILYATVRQVKNPGSGGLSASLPKGVTLDPAEFQLLSEAPLYKVGSPNPAIKEPRLAAADQMAIDAVMSSFENEADTIAQQVEEDAHRTAASKTTKAPRASSAHPEAK